MLNQHNSATIEAYPSGEWHTLKSTHHSMWNIRCEIAVMDDDIVLTDKCIVIPKAFQARVLEIAQEIRRGIPYQSVGSFESVAIMARPWSHFGCPQCRPVLGKLLA